jgi:hypothetical protein
VNSDGSEIDEFEALDQLKAGEEKSPLLSSSSEEALREIPIYVEGQYQTCASGSYHA